MLCWKRYCLETQFIRTAEQNKVRYALFTLNLLVECIVQLYYQKLIIDKSIC
jgi:hypothetical protein